MAEISVLMSLYIKEKPEYVQECFESLLRQTVPANEWIVVEDGPLSKEMYLLLDTYQQKYPGLIKRVPLKKNLGLGLALARGILECTCGLVARMDTDDICVPERFQKQLAEFYEDSELDIVGGHIREFDKTISDVISERRVPLTNKEIRKYQRLRSAFNHMTVMYKKDAVLKAGNYKDAPLMEDDLLWCEMLKSGAIGKNIDDVLVYARTGKAMIERRGGWNYFLKYRSGRKKILKTGYISLADYFVTCGIQLVIALLPVNLRLLFFKSVLRNRVDLERTHKKNKEG